MATFRSLLRCLVVGACSPLALAACGESGPDAVASGDTPSSDTGQTSLTTTGPATTGSSSSTTAASLTGTATTATGTLSTTGVGGSSTTTGGGLTGSSGSLDMGGAGGTGSGGTTTTRGPSSNSSGGQGAGGSGGVGTTSGGTGSSASECEFEGNIRYQFNQPGGWPSEVVELLTTALDEAMYYYNCYADLDKELTINYDPGVPTAQGNTDGWISFGDDRAYMVVATAMHEVAHTLGVAYSPWTEPISDGTWTGPAVVEFMTNLPAEQRDPDMYSQRTYITCDSQHFWPYGLNQASEHQSEWSLINNVRIVAAMQLDKQAYLAGEL